MLTAQQKDRTFDGLVAYWNTQDGATDFQKGFFCFPAPDDDVNHPGPARTFINPSTLPKLTPYFLDPDGIDPSKTDYAQAHAEQLRVKTLLIDPYAPIHAYSGILPIKSLQLPAWTLSEPMRNMTAFFSMGPVLLTRDVPKEFEPARQATTTSWLDKQGADTSNLPGDVKIPVAGTKGWVGGTSWMPESQYLLTKIRGNGGGCSRITTTLFRCLRRGTCLCRLTRTMGN